MDEATFKKELDKYRIVRPADYCKPRGSKTKSEARTSPRLPAPSAPPRHDPVVAAAAIAGSNFWEVLSTANGSILTAAESIKFVEAMKLVMKKCHFLFMIRYYQK